MTVNRNRQDRGSDSAAYRYVEGLTSAKLLVWCDARKRLL